MRTPIRIERPARRLDASDNGALSLRHGVTRRLLPLLLLLVVGSILRGTPGAWAEPDGKPTVVPAVLRTVTPSGVVRGSEVRFTLEGARIAEATGVFFDDPAIEGRLVEAGEGKKPDKVQVQATIGSEARLGIHRVFLQTPLGTTGSVTFAVGGWPEVEEKEPNDAESQASEIRLPATLVGALQKTGDVDVYRFEARAGQEIVFQALGASIRSKINAVLTLTDAGGRVLAQVNSAGNRAEPLLGHRFAGGGTHFITIRDFVDAGGGGVAYRLNIGEFAVVTSVFPLGSRRGTAATVHLAGFNLGGRDSMSFTAASAAAGGGTSATASRWGETTALPGAWLAAPRLVVGDDLEIQEAEERLGGEPAVRQRLAVPITVNGRIFRSDGRPDRDEYRFSAQRGQPLTLEVAARRLGSPLDSLIEVLDARGQPIERATIRPVAETTLVLNNRDSGSGSFRIQSWADLAVNDLVFCGRELLQITRLPGGPDEDVSFKSFRGRRIGLLDTTPEAQSVGASLYKVQIHPPGQSFSPNGMPVFRLYYRNDDGGVLYGKDSRLTFDPPADGEYLVRISDVRGEQGPEFAYRLSIHPPRPDYRLSINPAHPNLLRGSAVPVSVEVERHDGFDGPVKVSLEGLPPGFSCTPGVIAAGQNSATLTLAAAPDAGTSSGGRDARAPRVVGRAQIEGREVVRTVEPENGVRLLTVLPEPDLRVRTDVRQVNLEPGGEATVEVEIERRNGFKGRVPIDVRNLPYGVQVRDVGLNGVLVTEQQTSRRFVIVAEPWVEPQTRLFFAVGRVESDPGTEVAAEPLQLTIAPRGRQAAR